eukprot:8446821-Pyramimonas_sp.AAC.1
MAPPPHCCIPLTRSVAPQGAPLEVQVAQLAWRHRPMMPHPSHASWPHGELHPGPSGAARMTPPPNCGTPLTRFVAP